MTSQTTRLACKRTLMAGTCFAMAVGAFACSGNIGGGAIETGAGGSRAWGTGSAVGTVTGGQPGGATPLALDTGRAVIRRLNRTEYNFTVRDLLGTTSRPGDALPADQTSADGFDTVGE